MTDTINIQIGTFMIEPHGIVPAQIQEIDDFLKENKPIYILVEDFGQQIYTEEPIWENDSNIAPKALERRTVLKVSYNNEKYVCEFFYWEGIISEDQHISPQILQRTEKITVYPSQNCQFDCFGFGDLFQRLRGRELLSAKSIKITSENPIRIDENPEP